MLTTSTTSSGVRFLPRLTGSTWIGVVVILAVVEIAIRTEPIQNALPIRTHYHEAGVVRRVEALQRVLAQYGRVDVLFAGSSGVRCTIRPTEFDSLVSRSGELVSFNAGMSGLWPRAVRLYLEDLWLPQAHPRIVVQGIRYGELVASPRARSYDDIVHRGIVESAWVEGTRLGRLKAATFEHVHLLQYRGTWPSWLMRYRDGEPDDIEEDELRVVTDPRGWTPRLPTLDVVLASHRLDNERPNPAIDDVRRVADALEDIRSAALATRRAGAEYVLLNVPEHAFRWSGADGRARYASYLDTLRRLAADEGFAFVDVTDGDPQRFASAREYSDYHHMSPAGADRFTRLLAAEFGGHLQTLVAHDVASTRTATSTP
jgi:hypothetical protein